MNKDKFELTEDEKEFVIAVTGVLLDYESNNLFYSIGISKTDGSRHIFLCYNGPDGNGVESTYILANILTNDKDFSGLDFSFKEKDDDINASYGSGKKNWLDRLRGWWRR